MEILILIPVIQMQCQSHGFDSQGNQKLTKNSVHSLNVSRLISVTQMLKHGASNASVVGSIPIKSNCKKTNKN